MMDTLKEAARRAIPKRRCTFNGVAVRTYKWNNGAVRPDFEEAIAGELRKGVEPGQDVVVVGGGHGVCSTVAAKSGADVTVFEPGAFWASTIRETAGLNDVDIEVVHAAVGPRHDVWSSPMGADTLSPEDIPACDWLVLDCEGAEAEILDGLKIRPGRLSIETHPPRTSTSEIGVQVCSLGYTVTETVFGDGADVIHAISDD